MSNARIFRYFKTSPEIIRLAVMLYVRYPLSLRNAEDLLHERGIDITHETVRFWWNGFGTIFAAEIRRSRIQAMRHYRHRRWHLDEVYVRHCQIKIGVADDWIGVVRFECPVASASPTSEGFSLKVRHSLPNR
jgi:transposase-like protein